MLYLVYYPTFCALHIFMFNEILVYTELILQQQIMHYSMYNYLNGV